MKWSKINLYLIALLLKRNKIIDKSREKLKTFTELLNIFGFCYINENILEIGCYNGALSYLLAEKGARMVDGIDIKETFITEENHAMLLRPQFYKGHFHFLNIIKTKLETILIVRLWKRLVFLIQVLIVTNLIYHMIIYLVMQLSNI